MEFRVGNKVTGTVTEVVVRDSGVNYVELRIAGVSVLLTNEELLKPVANHKVGEKLHVFFTIVDFGRNAFAASQNFKHVEERVLSQHRFGNPGLAAGMLSLKKQA